ncbi:MFS transporter [Cohnella nanjingensis]|uniref:MFS transporter n=1 Tax=Cohnella nanjingensis TaxID=1387779 RepID=A0A7X0RQC5_9BACL|nr:MFS transporter [Cohnella nanjingensis]MBB6671601.1 MFS transporter [Cohnella nanjingensis]
MNRKLLYLLTLGVFMTATSELIVAGILNAIAADMGVSVAMAGQLITAYSLAFAVGTPLVVSLTSRLARKKLLLGALAAFIIGSLVSFASANYAMLVAGRIILGVSAGVYLVATFGAVTKLVPAEKIGSAMGTVILGFSTAMVLGVPIGIGITNGLGWHAIFLLLAAITLLILLGMAYLLPNIEGDEPVPFRRQFSVLAGPLVIAGLLLTFFREGGTSIMYTYMTPYLQTILGMKPAGVAALMLIFGLVGAAASRFGGYAVDRWGTIRMIAISLAVPVASLALVPLFETTLSASIAALTVWIFASFMAAPAIQTYFVQQAPQSANLIMSFTTSVTHLGIAAGAGLGGAAVSASSTVLYNPWLAGGILALGLAVALVLWSAQGRKKPQERATA